MGQTVLMTLCHFVPVLVKKKHERGREWGETDTWRDTHRDRVTVGETERGVRGDRETDGCKESQRDSKQRDSQIDGETER